MKGGEIIYLDTSGILAFLDADDACHREAVLAWRKVIEDDVVLVMTDYVRLECWSLIQRRLGFEVLTDFHERLLPICEIEPVAKLDSSFSHVRCCSAGAARSAWSIFPASTVCSGAASKRPWPSTGTSRSEGFGGRSRAHPTLMGDLRAADWRTNLVGTPDFTDGNHSVGAKAVPP